MSPPSSTALALLGLLLAAHIAAAAPAPAGDGACLLKLAVQPAQSKFKGSGNTTAPVPATITGTSIAAVGSVFLAVPSPTCPPELTAANAADVLQRASLGLRVSDKAAISFQPTDIEANVTTAPKDPTVEPLAVFNFLGLSIGLEGNEPLGADAVSVGTGSVADAKAAVQPLCSQLLLLNGTMDLSSMLGPRTANVRHVAYNRTLGAGLAVKKSGTAVGNATLYLSQVTLFFNISPEGTPGVEMSRAKYTIVGDLVATADLANPKAWNAVDAEDVDWADAPRMDAPVIIGSERVRPNPRLIGVNSTAPQQCVPTRSLEIGRAHV